MINLRLCLSQNGPIVIYLQVTNNPHELHKKLWQLEKVITLHKMLEAKKAQKADILSPESQINTELNTKIQTWKE